MNLVRYNATRIWAAIYAENCFQSKSGELCLEMRTLNRLISGFHGSTTAHICENFWKDGKWAPNVEMFAWRLGKEGLSGFSLLGCSFFFFFVNLVAESFLKNIYFSYLFIARAIAKAKDVLLSFDVNTGHEKEDALTKELLAKLLSQQLLCSPTFDESLMFRDADSLKLRDDLQSRFRNISQIMDCVECETCKVEEKKKLGFSVFYKGKKKIHAKLQMLGIGTALKILLPKKGNDVLILQRNEVIALLNTFQKLSESVRIVTLMRERVQQQRLQVDGKVEHDKETLPFLWLLIAFLTLLNLVF